MLNGTINSVLRVLTWACVCLLALLSLVPAQEMVRTGIPGGFEHFLAYAGSSFVAIAAYGRRCRRMRILVLFCVYAGSLEVLQHFSPGRHPAIADFAASAAGTLSGGLVTRLLFGRFVKADRDIA